MKNENKRIVKRPAPRYQVAVCKNVEEADGMRYCDWIEIGNVAYVWDKAQDVYHKMCDALLDAGLMDIQAGIVDEVRRYTSTKPIVR